MTEPTSDAAERDVVISSVTAPLACPSCGYELRDQPIVRERHYGIAIVRCPECGTVQPRNALSNPNSGRRLAAQSGCLAIGWWLLLLALAAGAAASFAGLAQSTGFAISLPYAQAVAAGVHVDPSIISRSFPDLDPQFRVGPFSRLPVSWLSKFDEQGLFDTLGGWQDVPAWTVMSDLLWLAALAPGWALVWAAALKHVSRWRLLALGVCSMLVGAIGLAAYYADSDAWRGWEYAMTIAEWRIGVYIGAMSIWIGAAAFLWSLWYARPLLRFIARSWAPPGVLIAMRDLWIADGLEPPIEAGSPLHSPS